MNKKWFNVLTSVFFSALLLVGCNVNDQDPAPPEEDQNNETENAPEEEGNDTENLPGVDENDTMNKDDEEDAEKDPEDPVEDPEDMNDKDRQDD